MKSKLKVNYRYNLKDYWVWFMILKKTKTIHIFWANITISYKKKFHRCLNVLISDIQNFVSSLNRHAQLTTPSSRTWWHLRIRCTAVRAAWWRAWPSWCSPASRCCWVPSACLCWTASSSSSKCRKPTPSKYILLIYIHFISDSCNRNINCIKWN